MPISLFKKIAADSLFRNSFFAMLTTAVVSGTGFVFWFVITRLFTDSDIGMATALISSMNIISIISLIGFNLVFIRFLSNSSEPNRNISTGLILVSGVALLLALLFVLLVDEFSTELAFVQEPLYGLLFIVFSIAMSLAILIESVFQSFRKLGFKLLNSSIANALKLILPFLFIGFGAYGIYVSAALVHVVNLLLGIFVLFRFFNFRPYFSIHKKLLAKTWRYSSVNYLATLLNLLPVSVLPIIIINELGPEHSAYFFIAAMIANLLYVIPWSAAGSLFAEGSHNEADLKDHLFKAIRIHALVLGPAIIVVLLVGEWVLGFFGESYARNATTFLYFAAIAGVAVAVQSTYNSLLQIKKDPTSIVVSNIFYGLVLLIGVYLLVPYGLTGVGIAWLAGNSAAAVASALGYHFGTQVQLRVHRALYVPKHVLSLKLRWLLVRALKTLQGKKQVTILCYPERPKWYHMLYMVAHFKGYALTNNPTSKFDMAFAFEDTTFKTTDETFQRLQRETHFINSRSLDISKFNVNTVFGKVFGYDLGVDPRTYQGTYIEKSDANAAHDGKIMNEPKEPVEGRTYQRFVDGQLDETYVREFRIMIYDLRIPFVTVRYKSVNDRFDTVLKVEQVDPQTVFSAEEIALILEFCREIGIEYGELDLIRDNTDQRIYIVDANNTAGGPLAGIHVTQEEYRKNRRLHAKCFAKAYERYVR